MKIIITGAAGFIGSTLADKLLSLGHEVSGVDNFDEFYSKEIKEENIKASLRNPLYHFYPIDILDLNTLCNTLTDNYDVIVHLAAKAGVRPSLKNPALYQRVNVEGTQNVISFAEQKKIGKIVFASSSSVYGVNENLPWKEDDQDLRPISPYASSKIAGEWLGRSLAYSSDIAFIALRFFTVFGPRQRPDLAINTFFRKIKNGEPITVFGDGSTIRDYTYVDNIVDGIIGVITIYNGKGFSVFNLGSHHPVKLLEMIHTVEEVIGIPAKIEFAPMQDGDVPKTYSDSTKAKDIFGFSPAISFKEGLRRYFKSITE